MTTPTHSVIEPGSVTLRQKVYDVLFFDLYPGVPASRIDSVVDRLFAEGLLEEDTVASPPVSKPPRSPMHTGSNTARQSVGLPGHCEDCATRGHVLAHPDLGCGDVGCTAHHDETAPG